MWYPCNCSDCDQEETLQFYPIEEDLWIDNITNMPQFPHPLQGFLPFKSDSENHQKLIVQNNLKNVLQKSSRIGVIPTNARPPRPPATTGLLQIEGPPQNIDKKVPSKSKPNSDSVEEYSPANSLEDGKPPKSELIQSWNENLENGNGTIKNNTICRKNKYTDTILKPDSSLPPVIRRRNQNIRKKLAASMADTTPFATNSWDKQPPVDIQKRSQSVSDEQWNQMLAIQGANPPKGYPGSAATSEVGGISPARRGYNTMGGNTRGMGRGMVSSSSVCDLNSLAQQQHPTAPQMAQQPHGYPNMQSANSFQQLSLVGYDPNMMWMQAPTPCALCQPSHMYPSSVGSGPMKRAASNISMNLTSMGSDVSGYPWAGGAHVHHHMPMGYPGYYPGCHQHMVPPGYGQGSAMSIPDSMRSFNRMPHSPAPSGRSSSHRSHKSSKSRSFGAADTGGRKSRNHSRKRSEESESESSSITNDDNLPAPSPKPGKPGGLAWQCDHCTFINPGHAQACGMCSKVPGKVNGRTSRRGNEHRKGDKRRDSRIDSTDNIRDTSDYDNHHRRDNRREGRLKSSGSIKSSSGKGRKKSYRRGSSSRSLSPSGSEAEEEGIHLERQLRNLRLSSRSRAGDYDGLSVTSRPREKERGSLKKEGKHGYKRRV